MKPIGTILLVGFILAGAVGCATVSVTYDYDPEADFSKLRTYDWQPIPKKGKAQTFVIKRIRTAVANELEAKGFTRSENPDFRVALHGGKERKVDVQEWGYVYGPRDYYRPHPGYGYPGPGPVRPGYPGRAGFDVVEYRSGTDVYEYEEGTLIIDIVDSGKKELLWRGSATGVIDPAAGPEERTQEINNIVGQILANFPPGAAPAK